MHLTKIPEGGRGSGFIGLDTFDQALFPWLHCPQDPLFIGIHIIGLHSPWATPTHSSTFIASSGSLLWGNPCILCFSPLYEPLLGLYPHLHPGLHKKIAYNPYELL
jgi:hypothetical protein